MNMYIDIPETVFDRLLKYAETSEKPLEFLITQAIKEYLFKHEDNGLKPNI